MHHGPIRQTGTARHLASAVLAAAALAGLTAGSASAITASTAGSPDEILPVNPGAEIGPGAAGWSGTPGYTTTPYGAPGEFLALTDSASIGPSLTDGGAVFFDPGYDPAARLTQVVDLARFVPRIASGELNELAIAMWMGGYGASPDTVDLDVTPLDSAGQPLAAPTRLNGSTPADRGNATKLIQRHTYAALPPATTGLHVELLATGQPGLKNHGYADELILFLVRRNAIYQAPVMTTGEDEGSRPIMPIGRERVAMPKITFARTAPAVISRRRLVLRPQAKLSCPKSGTKCAFRIIATGSGKTVASKTLTLAPGKRATPTVPLRPAAARALASGATISAKIVITADRVNDGADPITEERTARLTLPSSAR